MHQIDAGTISFKIKHEVDTLEIFYCLLHHEIEVKPGSYEKGDFHLSKNILLYLSELKIDF